MSNSWKVDVRHARGRWIASALVTVGPLRTELRLEAAGMTEAAARANLAAVIARYEETLGA